jgi:hypothetical protein
MQDPALPTPESILSTDPVAQDGSQLWSPPEECNYLPSLPEFESGTLLHGQGEDFAGIEWTSLPKDFHLEAHVDPSGSCPAELPTFFHTSRNHAPNECSLEMLHHAECDMRLSQLNLELCRQLRAHLHRPNTVSNGPVQRTHSTIASALRGLLQTTEAFIHILHCLSKGTELDMDSRCQAPSTLGTSMSQSSLTFISVLNLTSCFFRIVDLFNMLLSSLAIELATQSPLQRRSFSSSVTPGLQILPDLKLAGLAVQELSLQTKILVLTITHHFEAMERLLGLPADLRVSQCKDDNVYGLLSADWTGMLSSGRRERFELGWCGMGNWAMSIGSLRANMETLAKGF